MIAAGKRRKADDKFPLTRRGDGRWCKKVAGKMYYFTGSPDEALAQWESLSASLTTGHAPTVAVVKLVPVDDITPAPENDQIYDPVNYDDPEFLRLLEDVQQNGVRNPLIVSADGFIISGHRRYHAALCADGINDVPVQYSPIRRSDDIDAFVRELVRHNNQRVKNFKQLMREAAVNVDPAEAYNRLLTERAERAEIDSAPMVLGAKRRRPKISPVKREMLDAVLAILDRITVKPTTDRTIHYHLLNDPPLKNTRDPNSRYENDSDNLSYKNLCDLLTRARLEGIIPWSWIIDETRPVTTWNVHANPTSFIQDGLNSFLRGYWRDLLQSQPHYIEVLAEKNTVAGQIRDICGNYTVPMTSGRGFCSSRPRRDLMQRYFKSGKDKMILLIVSDLDPAGMSIAESFARSMRDDFGVEKIHATKVAITPEQVERYKLPHGAKAHDKQDYRRWEFVRRFGEYVYEVEALPDGELQRVLDEAIRGALDIEAYNHEVEMERRDSAEIEAAREVAMQALKSIDFGA